MLRRRLSTIRPFRNLRCTPCRNRVSDCQNRWPWSARRCKSTGLTIAQELRIRFIMSICQPSRDTVLLDVLAAPLKEASSCSTSFLDNAFGSSSLLVLRQRNLRESMCVDRPRSRPTLFANGLESLPESRHVKLMSQCKADIGSSSL